jgi:hypothetical protein
MKKCNRRSVIRFKWFGGSRTVISGVTNFAIHLSQPSANSELGFPVVAHDSFYMLVLYSHIANAVIDQEYEMSVIDTAS